MNGNAVPARNGKRRLRACHVVMLIAVLLAVLGAVYAGMRPRALVHVAHPAYEDVATTVATTGTVVPVHDFPARANFTGLVEGIYVHRGEKVHAGQMLVRLKDQYAVPRLDKARADLDDAILNEDNVAHNGSREDRITTQAELAKAQTERDQAAAALQAMQQIQKNGSVSGAEMESATARLQAAQASLGALKKRLTHRFSPELADVDYEIAQDELQDTLTQSKHATGGPLETPKEVQDAHIQERQKFTEMLDAKLQARKAQITWMRLTDRLDRWLASLDSAGTAPAR